MPETQQKSAEWEDTNDIRRRVVTVQNVSENDADFLARHEQEVTDALALYGQSSGKIFKTCEWEDRNGLQRKIITEKFEEETDLAFQDRHDAEVAAGIVLYGRATGPDQR